MSSLKESGHDSQFLETKDVGQASGTGQPSTGLIPEPQVSLVLAALAWVAASL